MARPWGEGSGNEMRSQGSAFPSVLSSWLLPWDAVLAQDRLPFCGPVGRLLSWTFPAGLRGLHVDLNTHPGGPVFAAEAFPHRSVDCLTVL